MPKVTFASSLKLGRSLNGKKVRVYRLSGESTTTPSNVSIHCFPMSDIRLVSSLAMKNDIFLVFFLNLGYKHGSFESNQKKRKRASDIKRLWHYYSLLSVKKVEKWHFIVRIILLIVMSPYTTPLVSVFFNATDCDIATTIMFVYPSFVYPIRPLDKRKIVLILNVIAS